MDISGRTALVTGANRGFGRHLAEQLRDRGATVYAAARRPEAIDFEGVIPLELDVSVSDSIDRAAAEATGVSILVNNAGSSTRSSVLTGSLDDIRVDMETHYFGSLLVTRAFAPQLATFESSAVLNILSFLSWLSLPGSGAYCAAKSAAWSMTNSLRQELASQGTRVSALHVGYMETDMTRGVKDAKSDPADVARIALDGIQRGDTEILADEASRVVRDKLSAGVAGLYPLFA